MTKIFAWGTFSRNPAKTAEKCVQKIKNKASDISCHTVPYVIQAIFREKIKKMKILLLFAMVFTYLHQKNWIICIN